MTDLHDVQAIEQRLYRIAQLAETVPTLEALVFADGVFTDDERRMLLAFRDLKDGLGQEAQPIVPGRLTTREQMALAWHRQQTAADKQALHRALTICDMIDALWQAKGGAA